MENVYHSHEKQNEWHKKNRLTHQNVLPHTNWQNVTKSWQDKKQNKLPAEQNSHFPSTRSPDNATARPLLPSSMPPQPKCVLPILVFIKIRTIVPYTLKLLP